MERGKRGKFKDTSGIGAWLGLAIGVAVGFIIAGIIGAVLAGLAGSACGDAAEDFIAERRRRKGESSDRPR